MRAIIDLVSCYFSQSSKLYGVLEASEHSFYVFLNRFGAVCSKISGVQKSLRLVMLSIRAKKSLLGESNPHQL